MKKAATRICILTAVSCIVMTLVDSVIQPGYFLKSAIKLIFFLVLPLLLLRHRNSLRCFLQADRHAMLTGGVLGLVTFGVIIGAYALLGSLMDLSAVPASLEKSAGVTKDNFLFVGTYIALCNSFLEEFFFRCFAFLQLREFTSRRFANCFSAAAFALYHVGMLITMIPPLLFALALVALFACGMLFNALDARRERFWASWLVHMGANLAINAVGMHLLGMF